MEGATLRVRLYLRTALFSLGGPEAHIPPGVSIIEGVLFDRPPGFLAVRTETLFDSRGRELPGESAHLQVPMSKIDHMLVLPE